VTTHTTALDLPKLDEMKTAIAQEVKWLDETPHGWLLLPLRWSICPIGMMCEPGSTSYERAIHPVARVAHQGHRRWSGHLPPEDEAKREESYLLDYFVRESPDHLGLLRVVLDILHKEGPGPPERLVRRSCGRG